MTDVGFSVSQSNLEQVKQYSASQEEHHRKIGFQDEFYSHLPRHCIVLTLRYEDIFGAAVTSFVAVLTVRPLVPPTVLAGPVTNRGNERNRATGQSHSRTCSLVPLCRTARNEKNEDSIFETLKFQNEL
jgi:hypothetical protein